MERWKEGSRNEINERDFSWFLPWLRIVTDVRKKEEKEKKTNKKKDSVNEHKNKENNEKYRSVDAVLIKTPTVKRHT